MNELQIHESLYNIKALVDDYTAKANEIIQLKSEVVHLKTLLAYAILRSGGILELYGSGMPKNLKSLIESGNVNVFADRSTAELTCDGKFVTNVLAFIEAANKLEQTT